MAEEILFKFEERMGKSEIADQLDKISEKLRSGESISFDSDKSVKLNPSDNPEFEVKVEEEGNETSLELEIEWNNEEDGSKDLNIS